MAAEIAHWFLNLPDVVQALIRAIIWVLFIFAPVPLFIWWERKLLSWMQDRIGPNRVGSVTFSKRGKAPAFLKGKSFTVFYGILQPLADGIKSFSKEDLAPNASDKFVYFLAPAVALFPAFAIGAIVPWASWRSLTPVGDVDIGVLYMLAISSLGVYGVVLAGYSSNNKYSLLGGLRSSAQLISYELSMGMSLAAIALATGSLRLTDMVQAQEGPFYGAVKFIQNWNVFTPFGFIAWVIFLICMVAETNRAPFDLPEAESELVAGYNTEYSTKKWVLFMMAEYVNMFIFGTVSVTVFWGGYNALPVNWEYLANNAPGGAVWAFLGQIQYWLAFLVFFAKGFAMISFYIWLRATMPRLRYDQLMSLGWKTLLPLATVNFMVVALWLVVTALMKVSSGDLIGILVGWVVVLVAGAVIYVLYRIRKAISPGESGRLEPRTITLVDPNKEATA
jgi:NADH-quinone oxidoreductase subunit H